MFAHQMTLRRLLDHLKLVASYQEVNKMTCQNLAVCFGPVLLSQRQEASCHTNRVFIDSEELASALHFKKHIEVLHYLLQLWPGESCVSSEPLCAVLVKHNHIGYFGLKHLFTAREHWWVDPGRVTQGQLQLKLEVIH